MNRELKALSDSETKFWKNLKNFISGVEKSKFLGNFSRKQPNRSKNRQSGGSQQILEKIVLCKKFRIARKVEGR